MISCETFAAMLALAVLRRPLLMMASNGSVGNVGVVSLNHRRWRASAAKTLRAVYSNTR
jgi:hypothetical protein